MNGKKVLRSLPLWQSLLFFGIPGAIMYFGFYVGGPYFAERGNVFIGTALPLTGTCALIFIIALVLFRLEGNEMTWPSFQERFRLHAPKKKDWIWIIGVFFAIQILEAILVFSGISLKAIPFFRVPDFVPFPINPDKGTTIPPTEFLGVVLKGAWWMIPYWFVHLFFNIFGEEFMWRGYILPRQELSYGKWTWIINGLLWGFLFHAFMKWNFIGMLPEILLTPWIAQKTKSTWASIFTHGIGNLIILGVILPGIIG